MLTGAGGDETQDLIASEMPVSIVERFEMVDVDQEKGKRSVVRRRLRDGLSKEHLELSAVCKACQCIGATVIAGSIEALPESADLASMYLEHLDGLFNSFASCLKSRPATRQRPPWWHRDRATPASQRS